MNRIVDKANRTEKLKVSIIEPSGLLYGSELALLDILEQLDQTRFSPEVILPHGSPFSERLQAAGIPYREILQPMAHQTARFKKMLTYVKLAQYWRRHRPDLLYINQGGILRPIATIARWLDLPMICQVQTLEDARWVSKLTGIHAQVTTFVCNSNYVASQTKVPHERLSLLYYGYKRKGLLMPVRSTPQRPMEVGLLGRICEGKGHYLVVEVARRFKQMNSNEFHFRFIGDAATAEERKRIQDMVVAEGLEQMIEFRGYQTDIAGELAELDLMVIPSVAEPFGRIYCEAAEAQLPVLVSDGGGLGELAKYFRAGLLFSSGDAGDFLAKLTDLRLHYEVRRQEFVVAAGRMLSALDLGTYVEIVEQLLETVAARQSISLTWQGQDWEQH